MGNCFDDFLDQGPLKIIFEICCIILMIIGIIAIASLTYTGIVIGILAIVVGVLGFIAAFKGDREICCFTLWTLFLIGAIVLLVLSILSLVLIILGLVGGNRITGIVGHILVIMFLIALIIMGWMIKGGKKK